MAALAWSVTRARTFQDCRRRYYFRYLLAPRARRPHPPEMARQADRLKDLVGLEAWSATVIHAVIGEILGRWRVGREFGEEAASAHAVELLKRQFRGSHEFWTSSPDAFPFRPVLLDLHYYGDGRLGREHAARLKARVLQAVREFLRSDLALQIRRVGPREWLPIDRNAAARLEGDLLVLVKPDFAYYSGGLLHLLDWKTGRPDPFWETIQLACYALYAREKWGRPLAEIVPRVVQLYPSFHLSERIATPETIAEVTGYIRESWKEMAALPDVEGPEAFTLADDPRICGWCPFRGLCEGASRRENGAPDAASSFRVKEATPLYAGV